MEIPYPSTFNNTNCIIIPTMSGTTYSNMYVFKTNLSRTKYSVRNIIGTSGDYAFYLTFIKILNQIVYYIFEMKKYNNKEE